MISGDYHNPLLPHRARGPRRSGLCRCLVALSQLASLPLCTIAITGDTGILLMAYHVYKLFFLYAKPLMGRRNQALRRQVAFSGKITFRSSGTLGRSNTSSRVTPHTECGRSG